MSSAAERVHDMPFQDLYIQIDGDEVIARNPRMRPILWTPPEAMSSDLFALREKIVDVNSQIPAESEFSVIWDDMKLRVAMMETADGAFYVCRRLPSSIPKPGELGYPMPLLRRLHDVGAEAGLILLSGSAGTGKSTLAAALLRSYLHAYGDIAVTIEDPPELPLHGTHGKGRCMQIPAHNGDFATPLARAMRWAPRYLLIGEIRTPEAAAEALRAAVSGHLVLTTVHAGSVVESAMSVARLAASVTDIGLAWSLLGEAFQCGLHLSWVPGKRSPSVQWLFTRDQSGEVPGVRVCLKEGRPDKLNEAIRLQKHALLKPDMKPG